jgi:hypothetical protein
MPGVIAFLPEVEGLRGDIKVTAGKPGIVIMQVIVIKPFESLRGLL